MIPTSNLGTWPTQEHHLNQLEFIEEGHPGIESATVMPSNGSDSNIWESACYKRIWNSSSIPAKVRSSRLQPNISRKLFVSLVCLLMCRCTYILQLQSRKPTRFCFHGPISRFVDSWWVLIYWQVNVSPTNSNDAMLRRSTAVHFLHACPTISCAFLGRSKQRLRSSNNFFA